MINMELYVCDFCKEVMDIPHSHVIIHIYPSVEELELYFL